MHVASEIKFSGQRETDEGKRRKTVEYRQKVIVFDRGLISKNQTARGTGNLQKEVVSLSCLL